METTQKSNNWTKYYESQKKVWYDPDVPIYVKAIVRIVELHRSDSKGWSLSIRKIAALLGVTPNTALKYTDTALDLMFLESNGNHQRKRRKLRLSVSLRAPVEFDNPNLSKLSHWETQPVSPTNTPTVSSVNTVNSKEISNANSNESPQSQLNKEIEKSPPYKKEPPEPLSETIVQGKSEGLERLREKMKELGLLKKSF